MAPKDLSPLGEKERQKKPRHRHSPAQLLALNELYDKTEHPSLDQRTSLAERLGMETKTVNAWFQNKRASTKKRNKGSSSYDLPSISTLLGNIPTSTPPRANELEEYLDDDRSSIDTHPTRSSSLAVSLENPQRLSAFYAGNPEHQHSFAESETIPRRMRMRPSAKQADELRNLYNNNPHPTKEEREELGARIGMRYQSITNWFQNQRSLAKKRKEDEIDAVQTSMEAHESRTFSAFPPASNHPSLPLLPPTAHPSLLLSAVEKARRSPSIPPSPRRSLPRRSSTPYSTVSLPRPRRTRPEPYQLEALKRLFDRTTNPSIEERSALALEIGMDIGKVTNWFRNLRQTARKRAKKADAEDDGDQDDDYSTHGHLDSPSRAGTPLHSSSSSANEDDRMDLDSAEYEGHAHSDVGSDEEYQEAVTPSSEPSPSPPPPPLTKAPVRTQDARMSVLDMLVTPAELEKTTAATYSGVKIEDALLLLSFHKHVVQ